MKLHAYLKRSSKYLGANLRVRLTFHLLVLTLVMVMPYFFMHGTSQSMFFERFRVMALLAVGVYLLNVFVLIPSLLKTSNYLWYFSMLILAFYLAVVLFGVIDRPQFHEGIAPNFPRGFVKPRFPPIIFPLILINSVGIAFEMFLEWEYQKSLRQRVLQEKVVSELSFLKSQINPHFLFNSLNSIYSLAAAKSDKTVKAILMLSDLMRYMLYDSGNSKTKLQNEIEYLKNYIDLQKLRIAGKTSISITFDQSGEPNNIFIEPMLFIPFVENAFKHGISYSQNSFIKIKLVISSKLIEFTVTNTDHHLNSKEIIQSSEHSGIGLSNTVRRLELLYPQSHELNISHADGIYQANLKIQI